MTTLVGISGSLRRGSSNTQLLREAARAFGPCAFSFGDIRFPLYDGDLEKEEGVPEAVMALARRIRDADGVLIATPEYNRNLPGGLKNALDWLSRTRLAPFAGKPLAILSAAAGVSGGLRAQFSLRQCLVSFDSRILQAPEVAVSGANGAFDEEGRLKNERSRELLGQLMDKLKAEIALVSRA